MNVECRDEGIDHSRSEVSQEESGIAYSLKWTKRTYTECGVFQRDCSGQGVDESRPNGEYQERPAEPAASRPADVTEVID